MKFSEFILIIILVILALIIGIISVNHGCL